MSEGDPSKNASKLSDRAKSKMAVIKMDNFTSDLQMRSHNPYIDFIFEYFLNTIRKQIISIFQLKNARKPYPKL